MQRHFAIVPAAGSGSRFGAERPKQYLDLLGRPLIFHTLQTLVACPDIERVWVVLAPDDDWWSQYDWSELGSKLETLRCGGATRAASVGNGLRAAAMVAADDDWILVHDAARPCLSQAMLQALFAELAADPVGGLLAVPVADTLKRADAAGRVAATEPRDGLWQAQTPQMFRYGRLGAALENARAAGREVTGRGRRDRSRRRGAEAGTRRCDQSQGDLPGRPGVGRIDSAGAQMNFRVGQGYDVHRLVEGRKLILGGVEIPHATGLLGHSDADALLHAITDALLGAAALGDIGRHFPDTDPRYRGADSRVLLRAAVALLREKGWQPVNVDASLIAQQPKLAPFAKLMVDNVASDLCLSEDCVNIKGKTNERLGYLGREEAIEAQAVVLIERCV